MLIVGLILNTLTCMYTTSLLCPSFFALRCCLYFQQTLPEVCSEQDELDFLMEALIIR